MQTKELSSYEDAYQDFLANVLLKDLVKPENIRPTRQKQFNPLQVPNPDFDEESPISKSNPRFVSLQPEDHLVLFFLRQDTNGSSRTYQKDPSTLYHMRSWNVDIAVYGEHANKIINIIKQGQNMPKAIKHLNKMNFSLGDFDQNINTTDLLIYSKWYKQRRFNCSYNEVVETKLEHLQPEPMSTLGDINTKKKKMW